MADPPDRDKTLKPPITYDKSRKLINTSPGPKYLIMSRVNNTNTMANVSPFLIKKVIDSTCGGEVESCKKLRNGTLLIKTKNITQASKLIQLRSLNHDIEVDTTEHKSLNFVRGIFYSNELRGMPEEEIQSELSKQNVCKANKILKKVNNDLVETGLIIVTFNSITLPAEFKVGYEITELKPYIPLPLKCKNCLRYGHLAKKCDKNKTCAKCSNDYHVIEELGEVCTLDPTCINCREHNLPDIKHSHNNKSCPVFLKEKEIQTIITIEKVNKKTAIKKYNEKHPNISSTYAGITTSMNNSANSQKDPPKTTENNLNTMQAPKTKKIDPRDIKSYEDISDIESSDKDIEASCSSSQTSGKAKPLILPKNTSKRTLDRITNTGKKQKK